MPSRKKQSRVPGTRAVLDTSLGPVRVIKSANAPDCDQCGHNENVRRLWHGGKKVWYCDTHYRVSSTKRKDPTLKQRLMHRIPEADTFAISELLPNRAMRRKHGAR